MEAALAHLAHIRDYQLIIQLVEHWHTVGDPTAIARLAAVRALIELCQMDRAWARLRELLQEYPKWAHAHATAADLFLRRGWSKQARKPLEQGLEINPNHPKLREIQNRLREPIIENEPLPEKPTNTELLTRARALLATGSPVKGKAILYQLRRSQPEHPEVVQLLWACASDFKLRDASLWSHYAENDHSYEALSDLGEEPELTESSEQSDYDLSPTENHPNPFTDLFLHESDMRPESTHAGERTHSLRLAGTEELERGDGVDYVRLNMARDGDTEIRRVVNRDGQNQNYDTPDRIHANLPEDVTGFNLYSFRREMGMDTGGNDYDDIDDVDPLEEEDADLIVLVRSRPRRTGRKDDPTSEFLVPDATTSEPSEELSLLAIETTQADPKKTSLSDKATARHAPSMLPWILIIGILVISAFVILAISFI